MVIETVETFRLLADFEAVEKFVVGVFVVEAVELVLVVEAVKVVGTVAGDAVMIVGVIVVEDVVGTVIQ